MKKSFILILTLIIAVALSACGASSSAGGKDIKDVLGSAVKATKDLKSYSFNSTGDIAMQIPQLKSDEPVHMKMKISGDAVNDPIAAHMKTTVDMSELFDKAKELQDSSNMQIEIPDKLKKMTVESYIKNDKVYTQNPLTEEWTMQDINASQVQQNQEKQSPAEQLKQLKSLADNAKLEEKDDTYVISVKLNADEMNKELEQALQDQVGQLNQASGASDLTVKKASMVYTLDKKTYYPVKTHIDFTMTAKENGQDTDSNVVMDINYSNFNKIGNITVPDKVKQAAGPQQ